MAEIKKPCSARQAYNFKQDVQDRMGWIKSLKIGDTEFPADQTVKNPSDHSDVKVVAVLDDFSWQGGAAEPLNFRGRLSAKNKTELAQKLHQEMINTAVEVDFDIWEFDPVARKYFRCVHSNDTPLKGLIMKDGDRLLVQVSDTDNKDVPEPQNFSFSLSVMPERVEQHVHIAVSETGKLVKKWGVTVE